MTGLNDMRDPSLFQMPFFVSTEPIHRARCIEGDVNFR